MSELIKNSGDNSSQLTSLNEKIVEKDAKIEELLGTVAKSEQDTTRLKEENSSKEKQLNELSEKIKDLGEKVAHKDSIILEMESKQTSFQQELENLRADKEKIDKINQNSLDEISQYKKKLEESNKNYVIIKIFCFVF